MRWDILGHEWAVDLLAGQIARGALRHAYLFSGPQGIGRRTLALRFAQAINCPEAPAPAQPCGVCRTCLQIEEMRHPDLSVVAAEDVGGTLKVDQVRGLQHTLSLAPYAGEYRVALLLRFEEAHISAANALLKTLEEPPSRVVLLLTASSPDRVPETILSRCQLLRLRPMAIEILAESMQAEWGLSSEKSELLAHISGGRPGIARRFHQQEVDFEQRELWLNEHQGLLPAGRVERFRYADGISKDRGALREMLDVWSSFWRDVMILSAGSTSPLTNIHRRREIKAAAGALTTEKVRRMLLAIETTRERIDHNANVKLAAAALVLSLPRF